MGQYPKNILGLDLKPLSRRMKLLMRRSHDTVYAFCMVFMIMLHPRICGIALVRLINVAHHFIAGACIYNTTLGTLHLLMYVHGF